MKSINAKDIRVEDAINAHALTLTLRHFNIPDEMFSVSSQDDMYYVFMGEDVYDFPTFDSIPILIFCTLAKSPEELEEFRDFYSKVLRVGFSNNDALDYLKFYSESEKKLARVK